MNIFRSVAVILPEESFYLVVSSKFQWWLITIAGNSNSYMNKRSFLSSIGNKLSAQSLFAADMENLVSFGDLKIQKTEMIVVQKFEIVHGSIAIR